MLEQPQPREFPPINSQHDIPSELVADISGKNCVLFAGSGLGTAAGLPTRRTQFLELAKAIPHSDADVMELPDVLETEGIDAAFDALVAASSREEILAQFAPLLSTADPRIVTQLQGRLGQMPFRHCINTTLDSLLEDAFQWRNPLVIDGTQIADIEQAFSPSAVAFVRLYGSLRAPDSVRLSVQELRRFAYQSAIFGKAVASLVSASPVLFLGMSLDAIERIMSALPELADAMQSRRHYAVTTSRKNLRMRWQRAMHRYNIDVLYLQDDQGPRGLPKFVSFLAQELRMQPLAPAIEPIGTSESIRSVSLSNIGPFQGQSIVFNEGWNVILGDNGSGKSTILRAIALALCGDAQATTFAGKSLLRVGESSGRIELALENRRFITDLVRLTDGSVHVKSPFISPVQQGGWVVMGFPPLRGIFGQSPSSGLTPQKRPQVEDLMPLLNGSVDSRLDELKQWLLSTDAQYREQGNTSQAAKVLDTFGKIVKDFFPDSNVQFSHVDATTLEIVFATPDGNVPIEQLSQGMLSLLGWAALLLQRMHEVYSESPSPCAEPALVLVDELEAHLHPAWQQQIVPILKFHFPKLQIIATTHSPLIVTALKSENVLVAYRDAETKSIVVEQSKISVAGKPADQLLTSGLFGLETTRSPEIVQSLERYEELLDLGNTAASDEERMRLRASLNEALFADSNLSEGLAGTSMLDLIQQVPVENRKERIEAFLDVTSMLSGSRSVLSETATPESGLSL